jgi:hypothetical protein
MLEHEIDGLGGALFGGIDDVALVFAVFIIDQDDGLAEFEFFENFGDGGEGHGVWEL